jgi:hypothetical protein
MPKKSPTKGAARVMKNVLIRMPVDLHRRLRMEVASQGTTVRDFVTRLIEAATTKGGDKK